MATKVKDKKKARSEDREGRRPAAGRDVPQDDRPLLEGVKQLKPKTPAPGTVAESAGGGEFEVLAGSHWDENGAEHTKGDIVKSDDPLDEMFANKFSRVGGGTRRARYYDQTFITDSVMDPPEHKLRAMAAKAKKKAQESEEDDEPTGDAETHARLPQRNAPHPKAAHARGINPEEDEEDEELTEEEEEDTSDDDDTADSEAEAEVEDEGGEVDEDEDTEEEEEEAPKKKSKKSKTKKRR